jgi:hypothetical protein
MKSARARLEFLAATRDVAALREPPSKITAGSPKIVSIGLHESSTPMHSVQCRTKE